MGRKARLKQYRRELKKHWPMSGFPDDWMEIDRDYFEKHPTEIVYVRKPTENEIKDFHAKFKEASQQVPKRVQVTVIAEGVRHREFLF